MNLFIEWTVSPLAFEVGPLSFHWYGILFMTGVLLSNQYMKWMFQRESIDIKHLEKSFYIVFAGVVIGARLGHVFFYDWPYYSENLAEIPMIWKGGLASHGAAIGVLIAIWICSKYVLKSTFIWLTDRLVVAACIGSGFIRWGNLMNHEIIGNPTEVPWAFIFHNSEVDLLPRHPAQVYEILMFVVVFSLLHFLYKNGKAIGKPGLISGLFFILIPGLRFLIEFVKNSQGGFETNFGNVLSTGQWLSIPFVLAGIMLVVFSFKKRVVA